MAYNITAQRGEVEAYVMELICDTEADVATLPKDKSIAPGSSCLVTDTGNVYVLNSQKVWKQI